jgi:hypothetical protein
MAKQKREELIELAKRVLIETLHSHVVDFETSSPVDTLEDASTAFLNESSTPESNEEKLILAKQEATTTKLLSLVGKRSREQFKKLLIEYQDNEIALATIEHQMRYKRGLRDGILLAVEVFDAGATWPTRKPLARVASR